MNKTIAFTSEAYGYLLDHTPGRLIALVTMGDGMLLAVRQ